MASIELKIKDIMRRIQKIEDVIQKTNECLESGVHADWHGFRANFNPKLKQGKKLPPHKDWVRNVFIPDHIKALNKAENVLERFE